MKRISILLTVTALIVVCIVFYGAKNTKTTVVSGLSVQEHELAINVEAAGIVEENASTKIDVPGDDTVANILVKQGQRVQKDEPLAILASGSRLTSPGDGYIREIYSVLDTGGRPLLELSDSSSLVLRLPVDERDVYKISEGNDVNITCVAVPGKTYQGKLTEIASFARHGTSTKEASATVDVTVEFVGDIQGIRSGYTANACILGNRDENTITIPFDAIIYRNNESYVWLAKDRSAVLQKVETGIETDYETQIISGLSPGDVVILNPFWNPNSNIIIK